MHIPSFCKCKEAIDLAGNHLFSCKRLCSIFTKKHDFLLQEFVSLSNCAGIKTQKNHIQNFRQLREDDHRRTDLLFYGLGENGTRLYTDISIGHPCCRSYVNKACDTPGYTTNLINERKNRKYDEACREIGARFLPLAFEVFGRTSDEVMTLLKDLVQRSSEISQIPFPHLLSYWKRRLSTTLQKGNSLFIMETSEHILNRTNQYNHASNVTYDDVMNESVHCN